jgi:hypothetical protein
LIDASRQQIGWMIEIPAQKAGRRPYSLLQGKNIGAISGEMESSADSEIAGKQRFRAADLVRPDRKPL